MANKYMPLYAQLQQRGMNLGFHAGPNQNDSMTSTMNKFLSNHAISFVTCNMTYLTNWMINVMGAVHDATAGPLVSAAPVRDAAVDEDAQRLHPRHVLHFTAVRSDGPTNSGEHVPRDRCGAHVALLLRLATLGLRRAGPDHDHPLPV